MTGHLAPFHTFNFESCDLVSPSLALKYFQPIMIYFINQLEININLEVMPK